ncbi:MAG: ABC transporter substrate-binding protein [Chloroflexi bacterium]|nr:ABC transporter substrate-binding protein [Chloroflexota bacterium]
MKAVRFMPLAALMLLASGCALRPPQVLRIALVAPFEGRTRRIGYDAFPALRIAVRNAITADPARAVQIEFVAYNDDGDPATAQRVAHSVAIDPQVVAVIGNLQLSTTLAALNVYTTAGLPVLAPAVPSSQLPDDPLLFRMGPGTQAMTAIQCVGCAVVGAPEPDALPAAVRALAKFKDVSLGAAPTADSVVAYDAAALLLAAIHDAASTGPVDRTTVAQALQRVRFEGLTGTIHFDEHGIWPEAPAYVRSRSR